MTKEEKVFEISVFMLGFTGNEQRHKAVMEFLDEYLCDDPTHLTAENQRLREALEGLPKHKCRHCNGDGYTSEHDCNGIDSICQSSCPIPVQCEDCHGEGYYVTLDTIRQALNK